MKRNVLSMLGILLVSLMPVQAQEESALFGFEQDAQWYYGITDDGMGSGTGCIHMSVAGDTMLQGRLCTKLMIEACDGAYESMYEYIYPIGEKLYYYNFSAEDFFLLLDFSAQPGDTVWVHKTAFIPNPGFDPYQRWREIYEEVEDYFPFMAYRITAVDTVNMGERTLKRQEAQPITQRKTQEGMESSWWDFPGWHQGYIIESIGSIGGFFGEMQGLYPEWGKCWLRCFSMGGKTYMTDGKCDNVGTEPVLAQEPVSWRLFPQPAAGVVRASTSSDVAWQNGYWRMFDLTGKKVLNGMFADGHFEISLNGLSAGIYFIEITDNAGKRNRLKCMVAAR